MGYFEIFHGFCRYLEENYRILLWLSHHPFCSNPVPAHHPVVRPYTVWKVMSQKEVKREERAPFKLTVNQLNKIFWMVYGIQRPIIAFIRTLSLSFLNQMNPVHIQPDCLKSDSIIIPIYVYVSLVPFLQDCRLNYRRNSHLHAYYMPSALHHTI